MIIVQDQDFPMKNWKRSKFHDTKRPFFLILTILTNIQALSYLSQIMMFLAAKVNRCNCKWYHFRHVFRLQGKTGHKDWKLRKYKYLVRSGQEVGRVATPSVRVYQIVAGVYPSHHGVTQSGKSSAGCTPSYSGLYHVTGPHNGDSNIWLGCFPGNPTNI